MKLKIIVFFIAAALLSFLTFEKSNNLQNSINSFISTETILPVEHENIELTRNFKEIYISEVSSVLNSLWRNVEINLNEFDVISIEIGSILTENEVLYIRTMLDTFDDEYWEYENKEDTILVFLTFTNGYKEFTIKLNSDINEFHI